MRPLLLSFCLSLVALAPAGAEEAVKVLFFGAPTAHHPGHDPVTRYRVIEKALEPKGIDFTYVEDPAKVFDAEVLGDYDALLMYGNWEQHGKMPAKQLKALIDWVDDGGAFLPIHCASACYGDSAKFVKLVGGRFKSHETGVFKVTCVMPDHPVMKDYDGFEAWDETYVHDKHGKDRVILERREEEPWTWVREQGKGRVFYTAAGHDHRVWDVPAFQDLIRRAILWTTRRG